MGSNEVLTATNIIGGIMVLIGVIFVTSGKESHDDTD